MREAWVVEEAIPERHLPRVLNGRSRNWADRFQAGANLSRGRLRERRPERAKTDGRREKARRAAGRFGGGRRQSQAQTRGRHGDFTN